MSFVLVITGVLGFLIYLLICGRRKVPASTSKPQSEHQQYMDQRRQAQMSADAFPYLMFIAVLDPKTHPSHAALNGLIWRKDDPVWGTIYPPYGPGCRCRTRPLTEGQLKREKLMLSTSPKVLTRNTDGKHGLCFKNPQGEQVTVWLETE